MMIPTDKHIFKMGWNHQWNKRRAFGTKHLDLANQHYLPLEDKKNSTVFTVCFLCYTYMIHILIQQYLHVDNRR